MSALGTRNSLSVSSLCTWKFNKAWNLHEWYKLYANEKCIVFFFFLIVVAFVPHPPCYACFPPRHSIDVRVLTPHFHNFPRPCPCAPLFTSVFRASCSIGTETSADLCENFDICKGWSGLLVEWAICGPTFGWWIGNADTVELVEVLEKWWENYRCMMENCCGSISGW